MFINFKERKELREKLLEQDKRPPSSLTEVGYACNGGTEVYSRDQLIKLVMLTVEGFLRNTKDNVDLATFAVDLLEYSNGPRPEIDILPQGGDEWGKFKLKLEP
jgi:hypothetical protein